MGDPEAPAPGASRTALGRSGGRLAAFQRVHVAGLFEAEISERPGYRLCIDWDGVIQETEDPYSFPPLLGELDVHVLAEGRHRRIAERLGARPMTCEGVPGVRFAVWAPNARRVSVIGAFNTWDGRRHPMRLRHDCGVWEIFIPRLGAGELYKYEILGADGGLTERADPLARAAERPPATASIVADARPWAWSDAAWQGARAGKRIPLGRCGWTLTAVRRCSSSSISHLCRGTITAWACRRRGGGVKSSTRMRRRTADQAWAIWEASRRRRIPAMDFPPRSR